MREIKKIVESGVTSAEVKKHRELYEARSRVQLSSSGALAHAAHNIIVSGKTISYLDTFPKKMLSVTAKEVNNALKKYILLGSLSESSAGQV